MIVNVKVTIDNPAKRQFVATAIYLTGESKFIGTGTATSLDVAAGNALKALMAAGLPSVCAPLPSTVEAVSAGIPDPSIGDRFIVNMGRRPGCCKGTYATLQGITVLKDGRTSYRLVSDAGFQFDDSPSALDPIDMVRSKYTTSMDTKQLKLVSDKKEAK